VTWKGWAITIGLALLIGWLMLESGMFMHGDPVE